MLNPLRKMDWRSLSLKAKYACMGNSCIGNEPQIQTSDVPIRVFIPDWFDVSLSLKIIPDFDLDICDTVGIRLLQYRAHQKGSTKGKIYINKMCHDRKTQWQKDLKDAEYRKYDDSYKRRTASSIIKKYSPTQKK